MAVYVDNAEKEYRPYPKRLYKLNHMIADTVDELHAMARALGLKTAWFQPTSFPHYDVTIKNRERAIAMGAELLTERELVKKIQQLRKTAEYNTDIKKMGIACDHYKVDYFKEQLKANGYNNFEVTKGKDFTVITVHAPWHEADKVQKVCKECELYFKRRN